MPSKVIFHGGSIPLEPQAPKEEAKVLPSGGGAGLSSFQDVVERQAVLAGLSVATVAGDKWG